VTFLNIHYIFKQKTAPADGVYVREWMEIIYGERADNSFRLLQLHHASEEWPFGWKWPGILDNSKSAPSSAGTIVGMSTGEYLHLILIYVSPRVCSMLLKTNRWACI